MSWAQCSDCGREFGSDHAFDKHRVGVHAYTFLEGMRMDPPREDGRRCLDVEELEEAGWAPDRFGRWRTPGKAVPRERQVALFRHATP